ncbi:hypothetical protein [uncultured Eubacterium sp.]|uniref:hypothetical protein n=1 Tax=uncultured Eubacterium sp. TaxID=165185 RepID=UPI00260B746C|nr:hypothetical protein [uncultured Eubacterium sp.]
MKNTEKPIFALFITQRKSVYFCDFSQNCKKYIEIFGSSVIVLSVNRVSHYSLNKTTGGKYYE